LVRLLDQLGLARRGLDIREVSDILAVVVEALVMTKAFENVERQAMKLSSEERRALANRLLEIETELDPDWAEEIDRRVREIDEGKVKMIPWSQVKAEARKLIDS
jgi:putative addiction module component (TIGR02574 family)